MTTGAEEKTVKPKPSGRKPGAKSLTVRQKAEAAALWRSGSVTLEDLSKKYGKRTETFSRLFKRMGIEKGSGAAAAVKKAEEAITARVVSDIEETFKRISTVKESHFRMSQALAVMAFKDIQQAKAAGLDIGKLRDVMSVYKMAGEIVGNSRKELYEILDVAKHDKEKEDDDLPDLTVRELTQGEVDQLRDTVPEDLDGADLGEGMLDLDEEV